MVVWGGYFGSPTDTGGVYDPAADTWLASGTSTATGDPSGRFSNTAVWTGSRMVVWGGFDGSTDVNTGGVYDPATDSWLASGTSTSNAPSAREVHTAVSTGSKMIVWGGDDGSAVVKTGGVYDPGTNSWSGTSTSSGVPSERQLHTAVWTGSKMIAWGGSNVSILDTGGIWTPLSLYLKN